MGEALAKKPGIAKWFGKFDIKELSKISLFEGFYTSVCTTGLYFSSRFFARKQEGNTAHEHTAPIATAPVSEQADNQTPNKSFVKSLAKSPAASFKERYEAEAQHTPTLAV
jgi:hypothetical protein